MRVEADPPPPALPLLLAPVSPDALPPDDPPDWLPDWVPAEGSEGSDPPPAVDVEGMLPPEGEDDGLGDDVELPPEGLGVDGAPPPPAGLGVDELLLPLEPLDPPVSPEELGEEGDEGAPAPPPLFVLQPAAKRSTPMSGASAASRAGCDSIRTRFGLIVRFLWLPPEPSRLPQTRLR